MILDACANHRCWWPLGFGRHIALDNDHSVRPDLVGDFRTLPFRDAVFDEVWADPPHQIRAGVAHWRDGKGLGMSRYGCWPSRLDYCNGIRVLRAEALRVVRPGGRIYIKLLGRKEPEPRGRVPSMDDLADLLPEMKIARQEPSRLPWSKCTTVLFRERKSPAHQFLYRLDQETR